MQKDIERMSDNELLQELVRQGRRCERASRLRTAMIAALLLTIIVLALVYIPKIMAPLRQVSEGMGQIEATMGQVSEFFSKFDDETLQKFERAMDSLHETSEQVKGVMSTLKDSGLDSFKKTLDELNKSLSALGSLLPFFNR